MAHTNEEILLSSVCDRVMAFCNKLNKRLDKLDEQQHAHHQYDLTQPVQPFHPYPPAQPHSFHSADQPWQQMYQFGVPSWEEPTLHSQPPGPNTQPWQQPPDPPDWQRNTQLQPYGSHDFGATDLVVHGHTVAAVFSAETYTIPVTVAPPCTLLTDQQTHLNEYTQPHTSCNRVDWYNRSALIHGRPNHNPDFGGFPPHQFQQPQHEPNCQPSCWDLPKYQPPQGYLSYDQSPTRKLSCEDPAAHRAPQARLPYVQPPPHTAGSHHHVAVNITPSTAANPPPDSPNVVREDEEVVQKSSGKALWSNQSMTILGDEAYGHGMANDDKLASWRLKINASSPTKSSRDGHANALEDEEAAAVQEQVKQIKAQEEEFENLELEILHRKSRTRFEADRNFLVVLNSIVADLYHVTEYCGPAALAQL